MLRKIKTAALGLTLTIACTLPLPALAQFMLPPDLDSMPWVAPTGKPDDPLQDYYAGTIVAEYYPLWEFHIYYYPNGTRVLFYGHHYPDGTLHMGASQSYWRIVGTPGHYYECLSSDPDPKAKPQMCAPFTFNHYGDVWYQEYDRLSGRGGGIPTYNNVNEVFTLVPGRH